VKRSIAALVLVLGLLGAGAWGQAARTPSASTSPAQGTEGTLYQLQSAGGTLRQTSNGLRLVLRQPYAKVTTFSDGPARLGGFERLTRLVAGWGETFSIGAPNAALQVDGAPAARDIVLLALDGPTYSRAKKTIAFRVRRLSTTRNVHLRTLARQADTRVARKFGRATLFVDSAPAMTGFAVSFNLFGASSSSTNLTFFIDLGNSELMGGPTLEQQLPFGQAVTPAITSNIDDEVIQLQFPPGLQLIGTFVVDFPSSGSNVQGIVGLPEGYQLHLSTEAGSVSVFDSGPVTIPTPTPPNR
jgi:hypothetical protein